MDYSGPIREKLDKSGVCQECGEWTDSLIWRKEKPGKLYRWKVIKVCYKCKYKLEELW